MQEGDTVCLIGNAPADRMQHGGWVDTLLQSLLAGKTITFRNLAVSGDSVNSHPRTEDVPRP